MWAQALVKSFGENGNWVPTVKTQLPKRAKKIVGSILKNFWLGVVKKSEFHTRKEWYSHCQQKWWKKVGKKGCFFEASGREGISGLKAPAAGSGNGRETEVWKG